MASVGAIDLRVNSPSVLSPQDPEVRHLAIPSEHVKPKKKLSVLPTFLPPCRVCNATASGYHYGANTCEACKAFFRRSLNQKEAMKPCPHNGTCADNPKGKITCSSCRHKKCISIGMTREGCKKGRYTYMKRTQDTKEVKRQQANERFCKHFDLQYCAEVASMLAWQFQQSFQQLLIFYTSKKEVEMRIHELITSPQTQQEARMLYSPGHDPCDMAKEWYVTINERIELMKASQSAEELKMARSGVEDLIFSGWALQIEQILYGMTSFAKSLPGFSDLVMDDRIILLKQGRVDTIHVLRHPGMLLNVECMANYFIDSGDILLLPWILLRDVLGDDFMDSLRQTIYRIQKLSLNFEDTAVLLAFLICTPDRVGLQRSDQVEKIQDFMLPVLQYTLKKNHPDHPNIIPDILLLLPLLRENSEINIKTLGARRHKVRREVTPLIYEMLQD